MKVRVRVHAGSKRPRIEKDSAGILHVYVKSPPVEGKANVEVIRKLAEYYNVAKSKVILVKGMASKIKVLEVAE